MTNEEALIGVLKQYSCLNSFQIKGFAYRMFGVSLQPQSASGILRKYIRGGLAEKGPDGNGKMVYWLTDYGKEQLKGRTKNGV